MMTWVESNDLEVDVASQDPNVIQSPSPSNPPRRGVQAASENVGVLTRFPNMA
jgi:hypothetical protein